MGRMKAGKARTWVLAYNLCAREVETGGPGGSQIILIGERQSARDPVSKDVKGIFKDDTTAVLQMYMHPPTSYRLTHSYYENKIYRKSLIEWTIK